MGCFGRKIDGPGLPGLPGESLAFAEMNIVVFLVGVKRNLSLLNLSLACGFGA